MSGEELYGNPNTDPAQGNGDRTTFGHDTNPLMQNYTGRTFDRRQYGGQGQDEINGQYQAGTSGAEKAVSRYQTMGGVYAGQYQGMGQAAAARGQEMAARQAYQANYTNAMNDRMGQQDAAILQREAAYGAAPSQAELTGRRLNEQALQMQLAAAGSARGGPLAQAAAMQAAQGQAASQQQVTAQNAMAQRAQEMAAAREQYAQTTGQMRGLDYQQTGQELQNEQFQRQLNQQGELAQAQMQGNYEQMGQQAQQAYEQFGQNVENAQLQAGLQANAQDLGQWQAQEGFNQQNQDRTLKYIGAAMSAGGGFLGSVAGKACGGPVKGKVPYLVGEKGPELVVPREDGGPISTGGADPYGVGDPSMYDLDARDPYGVGDPSMYDMAARDRMRKKSADGSGSKALAGAGSGIQSAGKDLSAPTQSYQTKMDSGSEYQINVGHRAGGGSVSGRHPYLVGERGPELIVPRHDGVVIPADQTARILGHAREGGGPVDAGGAGDRGTINVLAPLPQGATTLQADERGARYVGPADASTSGASLSGPTPRYSKMAEAASATEEKQAKRAERKLSDAELSALADQQIARVKQQERASLAAGPAVRQAPPSRYDALAAEADRRLAAMKMAQAASLAQGPAVQPAYQAPPPVDPEQQARLSQAAAMYARAYGAR